MSRKEVKKGGEKSQTLCEIVDSYTRRQEILIVNYI